MHDFGMDFHVASGNETLSLHRYECDPLSDNDKSSSSEEDISTDSNTFCQGFQSHYSTEKSMRNKIKTKNEIGLDDLPPCEELFIEIPIPKEEMMLIGRIHSIVQKLVIVHGEETITPVDIDSVLFIAPDKPLGRVSDVFGPVVKPFYSIQFNNIEEIREKGLRIGDNVFFAPENSDITPCVFVEELQKEKEYDSLWKYNNEPPEKHLGFSDDEKEEAAKHKTKSKQRKRFLSSDVPAKIANVECKPPNQQIRAPIIQPPLSPLQVQIPVQQNQPPLINHQQPFQMQIPFQHTCHHFNSCFVPSIRPPIQPFTPPPIPYLPTPPSFRINNVAARQQFESEAPKLFQTQAPGIQQQRISVASSDVEYKPPNQQIRTPVFPPSQFQLQVQRPVQLVQAPLVNPQQPFQMQVPFQHTYHFNSCIKSQFVHPGLIQPLQQPLVPYPTVPISFQSHGISSNQQFLSPVPHLF